MKAQGLAVCSLFVVGVSPAAPAHAYGFRRAPINSEYSSDSLGPLGSLDSFADGSASFAQTQFAVSKGTERFSVGNEAGQAQSINAGNGDTNGFVGLMETGDASDLSKDPSSSAETQLANSGESKSPASFLQIKRKLRKLLRRSKEKRRKRSSSPSPPPPPVPLPENVPLAAKKRLVGGTDSGDKGEGTGGSNSGSPLQEQGLQNRPRTPTGASETEENDEHGSRGSSGGNEQHYHGNQGSLEQGTEDSSDQGATGGPGSSQQDG